MKKRLVWKLDNQRPDFSGKVFDIIKATWNINQYVEDEDGEIEVIRHPRHGHLFEPRHSLESYGEIVEIEEETGLNMLVGQVDLGKPILEETINPTAIQNWADQLEFGGGEPSEWEHVGLPCTATTKAGKPCKNARRPGHSTCHVHRGEEE